MARNSALDHKRDTAETVEGEVESVADRGGRGDAAERTAGPDDSIAEIEAIKERPAQTPSATRDLLANERTLLAWARTGVAIMGLGFVVARFGLVLRELAGIGAHRLPSGVSTAFGVALVLCGVLLLVLANMRYLRLTEDILHNRVRWDSRLGILLTGILVLAGIVLAVYLLLTG